MPDLSIVLCTYKRYDLALNCLAHLQRQDEPRNAFEIVVVDNTPPDLRERVDWTGAGADAVHLEDESGLSRARNRGIRESRSPLVAFIDDDAEACAGWVREILATFSSHPEAPVVGGKVVAKYLMATGRPDWMSKAMEGYLSCIDWGAGVAPLQRGQWIVGANMVFRREVFDRHGLFNPSLGRIGHGTLLSNEETHLLAQLPPGSIRYAGAMRVDHLIPPERCVQSWFRKRVYWQAVSDLLSGIGTGSDGRWFFERFAAQLPAVPAEDRSFRALSRPSRTAEDFQRQLDMIYALAMAAGLGLPDIGGEPFRDEDA